MNINDVKELKAIAYKKEHPWGGPVAVAGYVVVLAAFAGTVAFFLIRHRR